MSSSALGACRFTSAVMPDFKGTRVFGDERPVRRATRDQAWCYHRAESRKLLVRRRRKIKAVATQPKNSTVRPGTATWGALSTAHI